MSKLLKAIRRPREIPLFAKSKIFRVRRRALLWYIDKFCDDETIEKVVNGYRMRLDLSDKGISTDLAASKVREPVTTKVYEEELRKISYTKDNINVLEIGANIGYYALLAAKVLGESGNIYAAEVDPENVQRCKENIRLNGWGDRIALSNVGIGEESGEMTLYRSDHSNLHTLRGDAVDELLDTETRNVVEEDTVDVLSVEEYIAQNQLSEDDVNVIRMDVEGFEASIFRGLEGVFASDSPLILQVELHTDILSENELDYMIGVLKDSGLEIVSAAYGPREVTVSEFDQLRDAAAIEVVATR